MDYDDQLNAWIAGTSLHDSENDRHVPDYSCCKPRLQADTALRKRFVQAYKEGDVATGTVIVESFTAAMVTALGIHPYMHVDEINPILH